jgi:uridine phosphorylase
VRDPREVPLLEFDPDRRAIVEPAAAVRAFDVPPAFVLCFFRDAIARLAAEPGVREIGSLESEMGRHAVFGMGDGDRRVGVALAGVGAPLAAGWLEELIAMGARRVVVAGGAGALVPELALGHVVVPLAAVRDEGTSYHYAPPARLAAPTEAAVGAVLATLDRHGVPYRAGITWTTDAFYRETRARTATRVDEGCITVEMEAAALFAVARFRGIELAQMLYAGDSLAGEAWDSREWQGHSTGRDALLRLALEAVLAIPGA